MNDLIERLAFVIGPGVEIHESKGFPMNRFGVFYEFPISDDLALAPAAFWDVIYSKQPDYILGVTVIKKW